MDFDKIRAQRKGPIPPAELLGTKDKPPDQFSQEKQDDDEQCFEDLLEDEFDDATELPEILESDFETIVALKDIPDVLLISKLNEFYSVAMLVIDEINQCLSLGNMNTSALELKLDRIVKVFHIATVEYGQVHGLSKLLCCWKDIDIQATVAKTIFSYLYIVATQTEFPLSVYKRSISDETDIRRRSVLIKSKCYDVLSHQFISQKTEGLLDHWID